jgi:hypothetical protein
LESQNHSGVCALFAIFVAKSANFEQSSANTRPLAPQRVWLKVYEDCVALAAESKSAMKEATAQRLP